MLIGRNDDHRRNLNHQFVANSEPLQLFLCCHWYGTFYMVVITSAHVLSSFSIFHVPGHICVPDVRGHHSTLSMCIFITMKYIIRSDMQKRSQEGHSSISVGSGWPSHLLQWLFSCHTKVCVKNDCAPMASQLSCVVLYRISLPLPSLLGRPPPQFSHFHLLRNRREHAGGEARRSQQISQ